MCEIESSILFGDSLFVLDRLPKEHFSLLLTDPPYCVSRKNNFTTLNRQGVDFGDWDQSFDQLTWISKALPLLRPGASIVIWNDWKKLGAIADFLEEAGVSVKRMLTWRKRNPSPFNCKHMFVQATEHAIWAVKRPKGKNKKVYNGGYHHGVFEYSVDTSSPHPTKKPQGLFEEIISKLSNPGEWVLDPFAGAGTTALAAEKLKRKHLSIEKDPDFYALAAKSLKEMREGIAV